MDVKQTKSVMIPVYAFRLDNLDVVLHPFVIISRPLFSRGLKILALDENGEPTTETRNIV
jgi:hypothetical protein